MTTSVLPPVKMTGMTTVFDKGHQAMKKTSWVAEPDKDLVYRIMIASNTNSMKPLMEL